MGVSYSKRLVDCVGGRSKYLADGDSWEEFQRSTPELDFTALSEGSISYFVAQFACSKR